MARTVILFFVSCARRQKHDDSPSSHHPRFCRGTANTFPPFRSRWQSPAPLGSGWQLLLSICAHCVRSGPPTASFVLLTQNSSAAGPSRLNATVARVLTASICLRPEQQGFSPPERYAPQQPASRWSPKARWQFLKAGHNEQNRSLLPQEYLQMNNVFHNFADGQSVLWGYCLTINDRREENEHLPHL